MRWQPSERSPGGVGWRADGPQKPRKGRYAEAKARNNQAATHMHEYVVAYPFGAFLAQPAGRFHPTLSANSRRQSARRAGLAA